MNEQQHQAMQVHAINKFQAWLDREDCSQLSCEICDLPGTGVPMAQQQRSPCRPHSSQTQTAGAGRGVRATESIKAGSLLIQVPDDSVLMPHTSW